LLFVSDTDSDSSRLMIITLIRLRLLHLMLSYGYVMRLLYDATVLHTLVVIIVV